MISCSLNLKLMKMTSSIVWVLKLKTMWSLCNLRLEAIFSEWFPPQSFTKECKLNMDGLAKQPRLKQIQWLPSTITFWMIEKSWTQIIMFTTSKISPCYNSLNGKSIGNRCSHRSLGLSILCTPSGLIFCQGNLRKYQMSNTFVWSKELRDSESCHLSSAKIFMLATLSLLGTMSHQWIFSNQIMNDSHTLCNWILLK